MAQIDYRFRLAPPPPPPRRRGLPPGSGPLTALVLLLLAGIGLVWQFQILDGQLRGLEDELAQLQTATERQERRMTRLTTAALGDRPLLSARLGEEQTAELTLHLAPVEENRAERYLQAAAAAELRLFLRDLGGDRLLEGLAALEGLVSGEVRLAGGEWTLTDREGLILTLRLGAVDWGRLQRLIAALEHDPRFGHPALQSLVSLADGGQELELRLPLLPVMEGW